MNQREKKGQSILDTKSDYIVLDLETTGLSPWYDEIIEIGAMKIIDNKVVEIYSTLVKPQNIISPFITSLTGITNEMVKDAPAISDVLPDFINFLGNSTIVGHNVNFDVNFLYDNCLKIGHDLTNDFIDTMRLSRRLFKNYENHKLITLCQNFCVTLPNHRALSDCQSTYECYNYISDYIAKNQIDLSEQITKVRSKINVKNIIPQVEYFNEDHPLYKKVCVFTGKLSKSREELLQLVANVGGIPSDNFNKKTNYLIVGDQDYRIVGSDGKSGKQEKAKKYIEDGIDIKILSENVFWDLLNAL